MYKRLIITHVLTTLVACQTGFAARGNLFNLTFSGNPITPAISATLCLNGLGPLSCQTYGIPNLHFSIRTTIPNFTYNIAGVKINNTQGNLVLGGCTPQPNGFCLFSVSDTEPANIVINSTTPIVFLSQTATPGDMSNNSQNLTGVAGANALCNDDAETYGTPAVKAHANYTALLITSSLTPCSQIGSTIGCAGQYASPMWPLTPGVTYFNPDGTTPFNTVNTNASFPDTSAEDPNSPPNLRYPNNDAPPSGTNFWFGPMSVFLDQSSLALTAWAYGDLAHDPLSYAANFDLCTPNGGVDPGREWMSNAEFRFGAFGATGAIFQCGGSSCGVPNAWQNYYYNGINGANSDTYSNANYQLCNIDLHVLCVSSP